MAACQYSGVSVAAIALEHGLNANLLRRWVTEHERYGHHGGDISAKPPRTISQSQSAPASTLPAPFVPVSMAATGPNDAAINIDMTRGLGWPPSDDAAASVS